MWVKNAAKALKFGGAQGRTICGLGYHSCPRDLTLFFGVPSLNPEPLGLIWYLATEPRRSTYLETAIKYLEAPPFVTSYHSMRNGSHSLFLLLACDTRRVQPGPGGILDVQVFMPP